MKPTFNHFLISFVLLFSISLNAQVGIGTVLPDDSSMLDIFSVEKGFLMPRLTTTERNNMVLPANGLMIFNTSYNDGQLNTGTPLNPIWVGVKEQNEPTVDSVDSGGPISTTSTSSLLVPGMTVSPQVGTFLVLFNAQQNNFEGSSFSSNQAIIDMDQVYQDLITMPGGVPHAVVFAGGEILSPGVYDVAGAVSIGAGILTLDGGGDPDSVFIIRSTGAFTTAATTVVNLINGATSNNVFWTSPVAMSTEAGGVVMKGTLVSLAGAISLGSGSSLEGRMFTKSGAVSIAAGCIVTVPLGVSYIDLGVLSTFAMWSSVGAISDAAGSSITGDVGTGAGAIAIEATHFGAVYSPGTMPTTAAADATTYSIYLNGLEVANSSRIIKLNSSVVSLQAMITTLTVGEYIEVRWKVDGGESILNNRVLSLIRSVY